MAEVWPLSKICQVRPAQNESVSRFSRSRSGDLTDWPIFQGGYKRARFITVVSSSMNTAFHSPPKKSTMCQNPAAVAGFAP